MLPPNWLIFPIPSFSISLCITVVDIWPVLDWPEAVWQDPWPDREREGRGSQTGVRRPGTRRQRPLHPAHSVLCSQRQHAHRQRRGEQMHLLWCSALYWLMLFSDVQWCSVQWWEVMLCFSDVQVSDDIAQWGCFSVMFGDVVLQWCSVIIHSVWCCCFF